MATPSPAAPDVRPFGGGEAGHARLREIIREKSFRLGESFTLASGVESNVYFNLKPTMLDAEGAAILATLIVERLAPLGIDAVGGLELGAVPLVSVAAARSHDLGAPLRAFIVRKAPKQHGARLALEGLARGETLEGRRVALLEDVCTTGVSVFKAVDAAREAGATVIMVLAVVDREEGAKAYVESQGIAFDALFRASEFIPPGYPRLPPVSA